MHTWWYWTEFLWANENVAYLYHAVSGSVLAQLVVAQTKSFLSQRADACQIPWSLVLVWQASSGSSKPQASLGAWFSELDCNQLDINCQFLQQLTSPNYLHYGRWSFLTKKCNSAFWTLDSSTSWIQSGWLQFSDGGTWPSWNVRVPFWDFYSKWLYRPVFLQFRTTMGVEYVYRILLPG